MNIRTVIDDGYDMRAEMKKLNYTFRSLGEKTGLNFAYLQKVAAGVITVSKEQAIFIRNKIVEPSFNK